MKRVAVPLRETEAVKVSSYFFCLFLIIFYTYSLTALVLIIFYGNVKYQSDSIPRRILSRLQAIFFFCRLLWRRRKFSWNTFICPHSRFVRICIVLFRLWNVIEMASCRPNESGVGVFHVHANGWDLTSWEIFLGWSKILEHSHIRSCCEKPSTNDISFTTCAIWLESKGEFNLRRLESLVDYS